MNQEKTLGDLLIGVFGNIIEAQRHLAHTIRPQKKHCLYCCDEFEGLGDFCCQAHEDLYNAGEAEANQRNEGFDERPDDKKERKNV